LGRIDAHAQAFAVVHAALRRNPTIQYLQLVKCVLDEDDVFEAVQDCNIHLNYCHVGFAYSHAGRRIDELCAFNKKWLDIYESSWCQDGLFRLFPGRCLKPVILRKLWPGDVAALCVEDLAYTWSVSDALILLHTCSLVSPYTQPITLKEESLSGPKAHELTCALLFLLSCGFSLMPVELWDGLRDFVQMYCGPALKVGDRILSRVFEVPDRGAFVFVLLPNFAADMDAHVRQVDVRNLCRQLDDMSACSESEAVVLQTPDGTSLRVRVPRCLSRNVPVFELQFDDDHQSIFSDSGVFEMSEAALLAVVSLLVHGNVSSVLNPENLSELLDAAQMLGLTQLQDQCESLSVSFFDEIPLSSAIGYSKSELQDLFELAHSFGMLRLERVLQDCRARFQHVLK
jgi:hypothetical protein